MTKLIPFVVLTTMLVGVTCTLRAQSSPAKAPSDSGQKMTDQVFKNIQVLKGIPADQLIPAMQFITSSLGVECDFCHVQNAFDKDEKKPKQTRKMMEMMFAINKENFDGRREVTCYSCHRGSPHPVGIPVISSEKRTEEPMEAPEPVPANLPTADQLIDRYVQALGGAQKIQRITSRVERGTINFGGREFPVQIFNQAPDKPTSIMHLPNGDTVATYDGHTGWLASAGRPVREMTGSDLDAAKLDADLHFPIEMKQIFSDFNVERPEKIGDGEAYVISGLREGQPPMKFYLDEKSGLLLRIVRYAESPLGRNPTQIDYGDYRDVNGVKTPFQWTIARPAGQFTIRVEQVQTKCPYRRDEVREARICNPGARAAVSVNSFDPALLGGRGRPPDSQRNAGATIAPPRLISGEEKIMGFRNLLASLTLLITATVLASTGALIVTIKEYDVPTPKARPHDPAVSPDGALWVTEQMANKLGRMDPNTGQFREYPLKTPDSGPHGLVADKQGNIWFAAIFKGYIGKLDPKSGEITEYRMRDPRAKDPHTPVFDQKGILWFTLQESSMVGRLDPGTGDIKVKPTPTQNAVPYGIVVTQDGVPFFCEFGTNKLGSIDPQSMAIHEYPLPEGARPRRLALASDGTIYYTDYERGYLGHFDTKSQKHEEWPSPGGSGSEPYGITTTPDGMIWYSESGVNPNTLVRFDPKTKGFAKTAIPSGGGVVRNMAATKDGKIYLACSGVNKVAVVTP